MKRINRTGLLLAIIGSATSLHATPIYDNSANDLMARFSPGTTEVGDEILLAGSERYLTNFSFEYYGTNTASPGNASFAGPVEARVRFYKNDGTPFNGFATPGTILYDSGWFGGFKPTARSTLNFFAGTDFPANGQLLDVSSNMTWSIQFRGMAITDEVGIDLYSPPVAGANYPDFWDNGSGWQLMIHVVPMDFAAKMEATIPEPSELALSIVAGLGILVLIRFLRRRK